MIRSALSRAWAIARPIIHGIGIVCGAALFLLYLATLLSLYAFFCENP